MKQSPCSDTSPRSRTTARSPDRARRTHICASLSASKYGKVKGKAFSGYLNGTFGMRNEQLLRNWTTLILAMLLSTASLAVPCAGAAGFPDKPITIVVPFPAGSTSDTIPRMVGPLISKSLGVPVIIENRGGANGTIGAAHVASSTADGYRIFALTIGYRASAILNSPRTVFGVERSCRGASPRYSGEVRRCPSSPTA
jgi:hypothetical protein